jgi:hypothetical protein
VLYVISSELKTFMSMGNSYVLPENSNFKGLPKGEASTFSEGYLSECAIVNIVYRMQLR